MQPTTRKPRVDGKRKPAIGRPARPENPAVTREERRHLAECCAFFMAARYREAGPGAIRESDVQNAEDEINEVIEKCRAARIGPVSKSPRRGASGMHRPDTAG